MVLARELRRRVSVAATWPDLWFKTHTGLFDLTARGAADRPAFHEWRRIGDI